MKPSIGFTPQQTAELVDVLCGAGIDFIKDDELQLDGTGRPFHERARAVMQVINRHAECGGRKVMFAFNLTGEIDEMRRRHDLVENFSGGTCVMASLNLMGVAGMIALGMRMRDYPFMRTGMAGAIFRGIPLSAGRTSLGKRSGGSSASTTCTSTASRISSASPTTASLNLPAPALPQCSTISLVW